MAKWAVFISGRGSNLQAILNLGSEIQVQLVVSNKASAYGLLRAKRHAIPIYLTDKKINWQDLDDKLQAAGVDCIFLAGFMKLLPADFVSKWSGRVLNVHPSLLPEFPGTHAIEKSFAAGGDMGVTVHEVIAEMDAGPIVLQKSIFATGKRSSALTLAEAEIEIAKTEQRLVTEAVRLWNLRHPSR